MISRWDICPIICDKEDLWNESGVYRCYHSVLPSRPHKCQILAITCSVLGLKNRNMSKVEAAIFINWVLLVCVQRERVTSCVCLPSDFFNFLSSLSFQSLLACRVRSSPQSPVSWTQQWAEPGSPKNKTKFLKKAPKGETEDIMPE